MMMIVGAAAFLAGELTAAPQATDEIIPVIEMENVPLTDAIRRLVAKARVNILLDPRLSAHPFDRVTVSVYWQGVTAAQALTALLDNHGLVLVQSKSSSR